jgi:nitroreductase
MDFIKQLEWRYATKAMNGEKVPQKKVDTILEATRLAPTSSGLQPIEIFVVTNQDLKEQIKPIANNQSMVADCSHLLIFTAWDTYTTERINKMFDLTNEVRGFTNEGWENYRKYLLSTYPSRSAEENFTHTSKQAYISLGMALAAAAVEEVDCTPMEGFNAAALDELLGLQEKGLKSVALLPLGYRNTEKDWLANLKKVRKATNEFITELK